MQKGKVKEPYNPNSLSQKNRGSKMANQPLDHSVIIYILFDK